MITSTVSSAKLAANQANAQKSTGPRTEEGKARVSRNALKTGLCSQDLLLPGEDPEEFDALERSYLRQILPLEDGPERTLFDELLASAWKLRRVQRLETGLLSQSGDLLAALDDEKLQKKLDNLARHKARLERTFHRSLKEIKALQTGRVMIMMLTQKFDAPDAGLPDWAKIKQTQARSKKSVDDQLCADIHRKMREGDSQIAEWRARMEAPAA